MLADRQAGRQAVQSNINIDPWPITKRIPGQSNKQFEWRCQSLPGAATHHFPQTELSHLMCPLTNRWHTCMLKHSTGSRTTLPVPSTAALYVLLLGYPSVSFPSSPFFNPIAILENCKTNQIAFHFLVTVGSLPSSSFFTFQSTRTTQQQQLT